MGAIQAHQPPCDSISYEIWRNPARASYWPAESQGWQGQAPIDHRNLEQRTEMETMKHGDQEKVATEQQR